MEWHFNNDMPIYTQLISQIKFGIVAGQLPPGARIPLAPMRALLMHNIKEFTHLASILPRVYEEFHGDF